jgi:hypothetical protein
MASLTNDVRCAQRSDLPQLAEWLCRVSSDPGSQCLHSWSGESPADLAERLTGYLADSELKYLLLERSGHLGAAIGAEYDTTLGRAWLHGPHVVLQDWEGIAHSLLQRLLRVLPSEVEHLTAYVNTQNVRARSFVSFRQACVRSRRLPG